MPTVELPGGQTAELMEPKELTRGQERELYKAWRAAISATARAREAGFDAEKVETWDLLNEVSPANAVFTDTLALTWLKAWSLDRPIPASSAEIDELPKDVADLIDLIAAEAHKLWKPIDFTPDGAADPKAGTGSSASSEASAPAS